MTYIQNIIEAMRRRDELMLPDRGNVMQAKRAAWRAFIALNGWRVSSRYFVFGDISGRKREPRPFWKADDKRYNDLIKVEDIIDHQSLLRTRGGHKMILTQPYNHIIVDEWRSWTAERGVEMFMPPDPLASFHCPGATLFIVLATPEIEVRWLLEQDGRLAHMWKRRAA